VLPFEVELGEVVTEFIYDLERAIPSDKTWMFVMLSPAQNSAVVQWLLSCSERPMQAVALWAKCLEHLDRRSGELMVSRMQLAESLGFPGTSVSAIMNEMKLCGVISTRRVKVRGMRGPGVVRYFLNPNVATHLPRKARDIAQENAPQLTLPAPKRRAWKPEVVA
jgi:hypothetical protein